MKRRYRNRRMSAEEKEILKNKVLDLLRAEQFMSQAEISRILDIDQNTTSRIKTELIENGQITQEEINRKKEIYKATLIEQSRIDPKQEQKQQIVEIINSVSQISIIDISRKARIPRNTVKRYVDELIDNGTISKDKIIRAKTNSPSVEIPINITEEKQKEILELLNLGYSYKFITKKVEISSFELNNYIDYLCKNRIITRAQIKKNQSNRKEDNKKFVLDSLKSKMTKSEIIKIREDLSTAVINRMVKEFIDNNLITEDEIVNGRLTIKEKYIDIVLDGLKKGFIMDEISKLDEDLTVPKVRNIKNKLIESGTITKEEIEEAKAKRYEYLAKLVKEELLKGSTYEQICSLDESNMLTIPRVAGIINKLKLENSITSEQMALAKQNRKVEKEKAKKEKMKHDILQLMIEDSNLTIRELNKELKFGQKIIGPLREELIEEISSKTDLETYLDEFKRDKLNELKESFVSLSYENKIIKYKRIIHLVNNMLFRKLLIICDDIEFLKRYFFLNDTFFTYENIELISINLAKFFKFDTSLSFLKECIIKNNDRLDLSLFQHIKEEIVRYLKEYRLNNGIQQDKDLDYEAYIRSISIFNNELFIDITKKKDYKTRTVIALKFGYIDGKYFSSSSIANFLHITTEEVNKIYINTLIEYREILLKEIANKESGLSKYLEMKD